MCRASAHRTVIYTVGREQTAEKDRDDRRKKTTDRQSEETGDKDNSCDLLRRTSMGGSSRSVGPNLTEAGKKCPRARGKRTS